MANDYPVGKNKPPKHSQFQKGQSGNPAGRPKGSKNAAAEFLDELDEKLILHEHGKPQKVSKRRLIFKAVINKAIKSDIRAAEIVMKWMKEMQPNTNDAKDILILDLQTQLDESKRKEGGVLAIPTAPPGMSLENLARMHGIPLSSDSDIPPPTKD